MRPNTPTMPQKRRTTSRRSSRPGKPAPATSAPHARARYPLPPLLAAAEGGDAHAVAKLLDDGADVNQRSALLPPYYGADALTIAAGNGHGAVVKVLLDCGAGLATESGVGTALAQAISYGRTDVARLLLSAGAREVGNGPFNAITGSHFDTLRALADAGVPLARLRSRWGESMLTEAATTSRPAVECLLEIGLKPTDGGPLCQAILSGDAGRVRILLDAGADPDAPTRKGDLPVMAACLVGELTVLEWIAELGADFSAVDGTGKDCRYWAGQSRHARRVLTWLGERGETSPAGAAAKKAAAKKVGPKSVVRHPPARRGRTREQ